MDTPDRHDDELLLAALRAGDEGAFARLVDEYTPMLLRLARQFVSTQAVAEDVVGETWLGVIQGLDRFEGRSSLRTWIFRILMNVARTRGVRERRTLPFSALGEAEDGSPLVDPDRFLPADDRFAGHWASPVRPWSMSPEELVVSAEALAQIEHAIDALPPVQQTVIRLRDVEGWSSDEVRELLDISAVNQRVLLHRARTKVRAALERELAT